MTADRSDARTPFKPVAAPVWERRFGRRAAVGGAVGAVAVMATGAYGLTRLATGGDEGKASTAQAAASAPTTPAESAALAPAVQTTQPPAASQATAPAQTQQVANLPAGMALVTSPRLPLWGIGETDVPAILAGAVKDWSAVGSPISLELTPVALEGQVPQGMTPAKTFASYDDLVAELAKSPGLVAMVPVEQVDFRANVLSVQGFDPLRDQQGGSPVVRVAFVGDIVPGRNVDAKMRYYGDFTRPFLKIAPELQQYHAAICNLEGNISPNIPPPTDPHTFSFVSDPKMLDGFKLAGIDAVSLANNHSVWNSAGWGTSAFTDTIDSLANAGIPYFGAGRSISEARAPWVLEVSGVRIAIIGIDGVTANKEQTQGVLSDYVGATDNGPGTNPFDTQQFVNDISAMAGQYDAVIPYFHMGVEYIPVPPDWALAGARAALDAGATMVVTNHPHLIQGMEDHKGKPIVYSVGNFIFDQMFSNEVRTGMILEIVLQNGKVVGLRQKGVEIEDFHQPRLMTAGEQASLMDRYWASSDIISGR